MADEYGDVLQLYRGAKYAEALAKAEQYLSGKPRDPQMRFLKGLVLTEQGKAADAIRIFTRLTEDYPELPEPYNNLAVIRATLNDWEGARQVLTQAVQVLPSYALAHENLGEVYLRLAEASWVQAARPGSPNGSAPLKLNLTRELLTRIAHLAPTESPNPRPGAPSPSPQ